VIFPDAEHVVSVEILRPPVKVGDVIETAEELDALPIVDSGRRPATAGSQQYGTGWATARPTWAGGCDAPSSPATVLYLPDGAA
jgi:hypothetical protein